MNKLHEKDKLRVYCSELFLWVNSRLVKILWFLVRIIDGSVRILTISFRKIGISVEIVAKGYANSKGCVSEASSTNMIMPKFDAKLSFYKSVF
ncbi:MAG: hypothetical protein KKF57_01330 [Firmicutes bacterium]|nr:hypothetical protein [Bacillota bacterium]